MNRNLKLWMGIFIGAIIAVVFLQTIGDSINASTVTQTYINQTVTCPAKGAAVTLQGKNYEGSPVVVNGSMVITTNFSLQQLISSGKHIVVLNNTGSDSYVGRPINVTYTYQPYGYVSESGGRSVTTLILIMAAVALLVFIVASLWQSEGVKNILYKVGAGR